MEVIPQKTPRRVYANGVLGASKGERGSIFCNLFLLLGLVPIRVRAMSLAEFQR